MAAKGFCEIDRLPAGRDVGRQPGYQDAGLAGALGAAVDQKTAVGPNIVRIRGGGQQRRGFRTRGKKPRRPRNAAGAPKIPGRNRMDCVAAREVKEFLAVGSPYRELSAIVRELNLPFRPAYWSSGKRA